MKILFLLPQVFIPPTKGNSYLIYNLLKYVTEHAACDLVMLSDKNVNKTEITSRIRKHFKSIGEIVIFNKPHNVSLFGARLRAVVYGLHPSIGNYRSIALHKWLQTKSVSNNYDIVHFDMFHMAQYINSCKSKLKLLVPSDAYSLTALNVCKGICSIRYKIKFFLEYLLMLNSERRLYRKFDVVCPVAEIDSQYLRRKVKQTEINTVGVGVGQEYALVEPRSFDNCNRDCGMLYIGPISLPWVAEYIIRFIKHSYQEIRNQIPEARLTILGKQPIPALKRLIDEDRNIQHFEFVEDYMGFINRDWVYVHPQHGSAGYKTKIQQVLALGLPVVGGELAFTGMDIVSGEHCYLCKSEKEFIESVIRLLRDEKLRERMGFAAAKKIREEYSIEKIGEIMMDVYRSTISQKNLAGNL